MALVHLSSQKRIKDLFMMNNECATEFSFNYKNVHESIRTCCGKVCIVEGSKRVLGYIVDKVEGNWKIVLSSNKHVWIARVNYS